MGAAALPLILTAVAAGGQYINTQNTARRQDQQAAQSIQHQSAIQQQADSAVNNEVQKLATSNSAGAAQTRLNDYMNVLRANKAKTDAGLTPNIGSTAFQTDAGNTAQGVNDYATKTAGLMSQMDAPGIQRQQEGFGYGNLATDLSGIQRQSQGQAFIDQLRQNAIRRNAKVDLASGLLSAYAGSKAGAAGGGGGFSFGPGTIGAGV